jgi:tetratricopeptide (TPR) repeat protein
MVQVNLDSPKEALASAQKAVGIKPDISYYHSVLAITLLDNNDKSEALKSAQEGIRLDPGSDYAYMVEGHIYTTMRQWQNALSSAERGLAIDAEDMDLINIRSVSLSKLGKRDDAASAIDTALRNDPDNAYTHANKGWNLMHAGKYEEAMLCFRESMRLQPGNEHARQGIIESVKAGTIIYRPILKTFLWMTTLPPNTTFALIFGFYILSRFLRVLQQSNPEYTPIFVVLQCIYIFIVYLSWTASTMFNIVLFAHPIGKHALRPIEKITCGISCTLLISGLTSLGILAYQLATSTPSQSLTYLALCSFIMVIPICGIEDRSEGKWRMIHISMCSVLALLSMGAILLPESGNMICFIVFVLILVIYTWTSNIKSFFPAAKYSTFDEK